MKKTLIVLMMVLLSAMLVVSCEANNSNTNNNGSSVVVHKVTFEYDNGDAAVVQEVKDGETVAEPADPTKDSLAFQYWSLDGTKFDLDTAITKDITLKAVWDNPSAVGQTIALGKKDDAGIVWQVLAVDTDKKQALLISKDILGTRTFGAKQESSPYNNYKGSAIQEYLNKVSEGGFIYDYGLSLVKMLKVDVTTAIETTTVISNDDEYDLVFLLSKTEYGSYKNTIATAGDTWWLRSPDGSMSVYVAEGKGDYKNSATVSTGYNYSLGVRPAFWYTWD